MESGSHAGSVPCDRGALLRLAACCARREMVAATLLETRLLYSSETRPLLPEVHAKRLEGVQMNWTGKSVKRHRCEGCRETNAQIRAEFSIPTVESKIRLRRMVFFVTAAHGLSLVSCNARSGLQLPDQGDWWILGSLANNAAEGTSNAASSG